MKSASTYLDTFVADPEAYSSLSKIGASQKTAYAKVWSDPVNRTYILIAIGGGLLSSIALDKVYVRTKQGDTDTNIRASSLVVASALTLGSVFLSLGWKANKAMYLK